MCTSFVHMVVVIIIPAAPRSNLFLCLVIHLFVGNCTVEMCIRDSEKLDIQNDKFD